MQPKYIIIVSFVSLAVFVLWKTISDRLEDEIPREDEEIPPFIPTHEWQEVKKNQSVPPGLNIRFDFETGKNYAKLLDPETKPTDNTYTIMKTPNMDN